MAYEFEKIEEALNEIGVDDEKIKTFFNLVMDMGIVFSSEQIDDGCVLREFTPSGYQGENPWCLIHRCFATHVVNVKYRTGKHVCKTYADEKGCACHPRKSE